MMAHLIPCVVLALAVACGGDDDGIPDGNGGGDGFEVREPADGQFKFLTTRYGEASTHESRVTGSIVDEVPRYHHFAREEGACRLWTWSVMDCECDFRVGLCNADAECVRFPVERSAGTISVLIDARPVVDVFFFPRTGYSGGIGIPDDLFEAGDRLTLRAVGGPDVPSFTLGGRMPEPIFIDLDYVPFGTSRTMLQMVDGQDLVLRWSPVVAESRVRLEILSSSRGHGQPRRAVIECESHDSGELVVPRAMVEAFPMFPALSGCPGFDCPEGRLTRYVIDRRQTGGLDIELMVGAEREFEPVHGDPGSGP